MVVPNWAEYHWFRAKIGDADAGVANAKATMAATATIEKEVLEVLVVLTVSPPAEIELACNSFVQFIGIVKHFSFHLIDITTR